MPSDDPPMHPAVQLRFTRPYLNYRRDELATFPLATAQDIVARRVAVAVAGVGPAPAPGATPTPQRMPGQRVEK